MKICYDFNFVSEFRHCLHIDKIYNDIPVAFELLEFTTNCKMHNECLPKNYIIAFLSGVHEVYNSSMGKKILKRGDMICLSKYSKVSGKTITSGKIVIIAFEMLLSSCDQNIIYDYLLSQPAKQIKIKPLSMCYPMLHFFQMITYLIEQEKVCIHLHEIKFKEFFILLRSFYEKEEIVHFLGESVSGMTEFSIFLYSNYHKVHDLQELIKESCYSRAVFYRKFKENFKDITPCKWLHIQKRALFLEIAAMPHMTPKTMMNHLNFKSMSTMRRICKELFDCTPALLISKIDNCKNNKQINLL